MRCETAHELLFDGEGAASDPALRGHIDTCAACSLEATRLEALDLLVRPLAIVAPPPVVAAGALRTALAARVVRVAPARAIQAERPLSLPAYVAAGLVLVLGMLLLGAMRLVPLEPLWGSFAGWRLALEWIVRLAASAHADLVRVLTPWVALAAVFWALTQIAPQGNGSAPHEAPSP